MRMLEYDLFSSQLFKSLCFKKLKGEHTIIKTLNSWKEFSMLGSW